MDKEPSFSFRELLSSFLKIFGSNFVANSKIEGNLTQNTTNTNNYFNIKISVRVVIIFVILFFIACYSFPILFFKSSTVQSNQYSDQKLQNNPCQSAAKDISLILIAPFYLTQGQQDYGWDREIEDSIIKKIKQLKINDIQIQRMKKSYDQDQTDLIKSDAQQCNASVIIWGQYSGARTTIRFMNLKNPKYYGSDILLNPVVNSDRSKENEFITEELPNDSSNIILFTNAQSLYYTGIYTQSLNLLEELTKDIDIGSVSDDLKDVYKSMYFLMGGIYYLQLYRDNQALEKSVLAYTKAIQIDSNYTDAHFSRGLIYIEKSDFGGAISDLSFVTEQQKDNVEAYNALGYAYLKQKKWKQAQSVLQQGTAISSTFANLSKNLGYVQYQLGEKDLGISNIEKSIDNTNINLSAHIEALGWLGEIYLKEERYQNVCHSVKKLEAINQEYQLADTSKSAIYVSYLQNQLHTRSFSCQP